MPSPIAFSRCLTFFFMALVLVLSGGYEPCSAKADLPTVFISPPKEAAVSGQKAKFTLFMHNPTDSVFITRAYPSLIVTLGAGDEQTVVKAIAEDPFSNSTISIPAGGYIGQTYGFVLPEQMSGTVSLSIKEFTTGPVLFTAMSKSEKLAADQKSGEEHIDSGQLVIGERQAEFQPFLNNLSAYEPFYFLLGASPGLEKSKFQISFKYKLFNQPFDRRGLNTFLDGFHLAYTQTSFWDLKSDSLPFDDSSYKPEIFYLIPKIDLNISRIRIFGIQGGYQHESNGKDGDDSRSTNYIYIKPIMTFQLFDNAYLFVSPKMWIYVMNEDESNPDLADYRGYFDLQVQTGVPMGLCLDTHTRWAKKGPTIQADLSYPLTSFFNNGLNLYLHLQYFNGYAERLKDYREKEEIFRIGVSLSR